MSEEECIHEMPKSWCATCNKLELGDEKPDVPLFKGLLRKK